MDGEPPKKCYVYKEALKRTKTTKTSPTTTVKLIKVQLDVHRCAPES